MGRGRGGGAGGWAKLTGIAGRLVACGWTREAWWRETGKAIDRLAAGSWKGGERLTKKESLSTILHKGCRGAEKLVAGWWKTGDRVGKATKKVGWLALRSEKADKGEGKASRSDGKKALSVADKG